MPGIMLAAGETSPAYPEIFAGAGKVGAARLNLKVVTMRNGHLIVACITAGLMLGSSGLAESDSGQAVPDAPQPQKKPAPKAPAPPNTSSTDSSSPPTQPADEKPAAKQPDSKDENAFPEAVSRQAAKEAGNSSGEAPDTTKKPTDDNPFPEDVSRQAAKDAQKAPEPPPTAPPRSDDLPPGVSSSSSRGDLGEPGAAPPQEPDPVRAKKDIDVGGFYLKKGDYKGALQRFKDATASDPTDVDAIFGLAETQRMLKNNTEAERNYQMYLEVVPNGPKAKQALKALKELQSAK
jgi:tetratricopeptide (TPR) repeat protein